jgi:PAP2 superfamily
MRLVTTILLLLPCLAFSQGDSLYTDSTSGKKIMVYKLKDQTLYYPKPKPFFFLTKAPKAFAGAAGIAFKKDSGPAWAIMTYATASFIMFDQQMINGVKRFSRTIHLDNTAIYHPILDFKVGSQNVLIYRAPGNLNTFLYQLGEGIPPLLISGGLFTYGLIKNDYRARSTANQITQVIITMGLATQTFKRISGRESPFRATSDGGRWSPFQSFSNYNRHVSQYDAFPSGHMATMMASLVVFADNYPEKHWIRPVGFAIMTLTGLAMLNTEVHWMSDYPLALGLGYVFGKATVKLNRWVRKN